MIEEKHLEKLRDAKIDERCTASSTRENEGPEDDVVLKTLTKDTLPGPGSGAQEDLQPDSSGRSTESRDRALAACSGCSSRPKRYDLAPVGRYKINRRLKLNVPQDVTTLDQADFVAVIACLLDMKAADAEPDDIDHLGNRRIRSVGELLGEPVLDRTGAHGAHRQGAHDAPAGHRSDHAVRPDQRAHRLAR